MPWDIPPVAVCTNCGAPLPKDQAQLIGELCRRKIDGRRCQGTYSSTLNHSDWMQCKLCKGTGSKGNSKCDLCRGSGWNYIRSQ
jgi:DnaJ-class molecular chaperone